MKRMCKDLISLLTVFVVGSTAVVAQHGVDTDPQPEFVADSELTDHGLIGEDELLEPDWEFEEDYVGLEMPEDSALDWIFYHYGTACFGMDWRFLRAIARAESGLDTTQRTGSYVGLFQWKKSDCAERQNMGPFTDFMTCDDLTDPEANTLVTAHRFHRMFMGERFVGGELQSDRSWPNAMLDVCPDASVEELVALAYVGHNNGPGVLKHALRYLRRTGEGCEYEQQERAVRSYYETSSGTKPATEEDVERCNERSNIKGRPNRLLTVGMRHRKCVTAGYGVDKWKYGIRKIVPFVEREGIAFLYHPDEVDPDFCPIYDGERLYELADLR